MYIYIYIGKIFNDNLKEFRSKYMKNVGDNVTNMFPVVMY